MTGWCAKCKDKRAMKDLSVGKTKKNTTMVRGTCHICGCKMCKFTSKETALKVVEENGLEKPEWLTI